MFQRNDERRKPLKRMKGMLAAALAGGLAFVGLTAVPASAALREGVVAGSLSVTTSANTTPLMAQQGIKILGEWIAPLGTLAGDTFTIGVPGEFNVPAGTTFELTQTGSATVYADCDAVGQLITCTYTDNAAAQPNVGGDFWFAGKATAANSATSYNFTVNGTTVPVDVPGGIQDTPGVERPQGTGFCYFESSSEFATDVRTSGGQILSGEIIVGRGAFKAGSGQVMVVPASEVYTGNNWTWRDPVGLVVTPTATGLTYTYDATGFAAGDTIRLVFAYTLVPTAATGEVISCAGTVNAFSWEKSGTNRFGGGGSGDGGTFVAPVVPTVTQSICTDAGTPSEPTITFADTAGVTYTTDIAPAPGATVTVTANADTAGGHVLQYDAAWTFESDSVATYQITFEQPVCSTIVTPITPTVTQAVCVDGATSDPTLTLAVTDGITYSITGIVAAGETVTVTATPGAAYVLGAADGWTQADDGTSSIEVVLEPGDCSPVAPVNPAVTQAVCAEGVPTAPSVTPATTAGIVYTVTGTVTPGATVTVTATPGAGSSIATTDGWTLQDDGTATFQIVLEPGDCTPATPLVPDVTQAACVDGATTDPTITPAATEGIAYTVTGTVAPGATVTVTATPEDGSTISPTEGWTAGENGTYTIEVPLEPGACTPIAPVTPSVVQEVCIDGATKAPTVTTATTEGITYVVTANVAPGATVTVTAIPSAGFAIAATEGWTAGENGVFTTTVTLADVACIPVTPVTPTVTPVTPTVTPSVCVDGEPSKPIVEVPVVPGIEYTTKNPGTPGSTVTVTAKPKPGYVLATVDGWTSHEDGSVTTTVTVDDLVSCAAKLAVTGANAALPLLGGAIALIMAGTLTMVIHRRRAAAV